jgi:hypothetical protein
MARIPRRAFNHKGPFVVRRPFKGEGRTWEPGQVFPAHQIPMSVRRLRIMHEQRLIDMLGEEAEQEGREGLQEDALGVATEPDPVATEPDPVPPAAEPEPKGKSKSRR